MSVEAMAVVLNHSQAKGDAKVIMIGIANHDGDGGAWPTVETLARYANVSERTVQRHLKALVESGELEIEKQGGGTSRTDPRYKPNLYVIHVECPEDCDRTMNHRRGGVTPAVTPAGSRGDRSASRGDRSGSSGVTPAVTRTVLEPSGEPSVENPVAADASTADEIVLIPEPEKVPPIEQRVTDWIYEQVSGAIAYVPVRQVVKWAIHDRPSAPNDVANAAVGLYRLGKPITKQTVGQWLDGIIREGGRSTDRQAEILRREREQALAADAARSNHGGVRQIGAGW